MKWEREEDVFSLSVCLLFVCVCQRGPSRMRCSKDWDDKASQYNG